MGKSLVSAAQHRQMDITAIAGQLCLNPGGVKRLRYRLAELR